MLNETLLNSYLQYHPYYLKHLRPGRQIKILRTILNFTTREFANTFSVLSSGEISFLERGERPLVDKAFSSFVSKFFPSCVALTKISPEYVEKLASSFTKMFYFESYLRSIENLYKTIKHLPLSLRFAVFSYFDFMNEINEKIPTFIELLSLWFLDKIELTDVFSYLSATGEKNIAPRLLDPLWDTVSTRDFAYQMSFPVLCDFLSLLCFEISFNFYNETTTVYFYDYVVDAAEFKGLALEIDWSNYRYEVVSPPPPEESS